MKSEKLTDQHDTSVGQRAKIRVPDTFHRPILENLHAVQAFYSFLAILGQHGELCTVDG